MLFYDFNLKAKDVFKITDSEDGEFKDNIQSTAEQLNAKGPDNVRFFVVSLSSHRMRLGAAIGYKNKRDPKELALEFAKGLGFEAKEVTAEEITIHTLVHMVNQSYHEDFIEDNDVFLHSINLDNNRICNSNIFSEIMAEENYTLEQANKDSIDVNCSNSLLEELERIYTVQPQKTFTGNPVHYIIYCDNWVNTIQITKILASALYSNGRLKSRRIALMKPEINSRKRMLDTEERLDQDVAGTLFNAQKGGCMLLRPGEMVTEGNIIDDNAVLPEDIAKFINNTKIETLSVISFNKTDKKAVEQLKTYTPNVRFVEIEETNFFRDRAIKILIKKASADNISKYGSLLAKIPLENKSYSINDINKIYDDWYNDRLALEVYPQYKDIEKPKITVQDTKGTAYSKLQSMIGLKNVKDVIQQAIDFNKASLFYSKAGLKKLQPSRHMVFSGNPGTAKTTVARLFAQIMKDNGVLEKGDLLEVGRKDLVGKYVGWTARLVEEAFGKARGSVLFIDEAYSLCEERGGLFGDEAINTIVQLMENDRTDTIVIFAGYPDKMEDFLDKNPGLRSRIAFNVNFDDYSNSELIEIFHHIAAENKTLLADGIDEKLQAIFSGVSKDRSFGNGRFVRNLYEQSRMKQASRLIQLDYEAVSDEEIRTLTPEDIVVTAVQKPEQETVHRVVGFAS